MKPADRLMFRQDVMLVYIPASEADALQARHNAPSMKRTRDSKEAPINRTAGLRKGYKIKIIEIGYYLARYDEKSKEKKEQHARLCHILQNGRHSVEFLPTILGSHATVSSSLPKAIAAFGPSWPRKSRIGSFEIEEGGRRKDTEFVLSLILFTLTMSHGDFVESGVGGVEKGKGKC